jgi:ATP:corrinoid adenosyltransferase
VVSFVYRVIGWVSDNAGDAKQRTRARMGKVRRMEGSGMKRIEVNVMKIGRGGKG